MEEFTRPEVIEWLESKGFTKNSISSWSLGNIRASFSTRPNMFFVTVRDGVSHTNRMQSCSALISHVLHSIEVRNVYMARLTEFSESIRKYLNQSHFMALDVVVGPRSAAVFSLHGHELFSLELDVEYFGKDMPMSFEFWCPDFETEIEEPKDIVKAAQRAHKNRHGAVLIKDGNTIVTTEDLQSFVSVMLSNACTNIQKTPCEIKEVCDLSDMQALLNFAPKTRTVSMYTIQFNDYVILDPVEVKEKRKNPFRKLAEATAEGSAE